MYSTVYWIDLPEPGRLGIMARPRADDWLADEISGWRAKKIDTVVSLLEPNEIQDLGLEREGELCREEGIDFISFPIPDRGVPSSIRDVTTLTQLLAHRIRKGRSVAVHCRAGIGRSSLIATCTLVCIGIDLETGLTIIERARGLKVPDTPEQIDWISMFKAAEASTRTN